MALGVKGGFSFPYSVARELPIVESGLPSRLIIRIPANFHITISIEETLSYSSVIADCEDGSVLLSPVSGTVLSMTKDTVEIEPNVSQDEDGYPLAEKLTDLSAHEIVEHIRNAGLMAERGFPLWRMLSTIQRADMLILNAVECEPGVSSVHAMLRAYPDRILGGLKILMRALTLPKAMVVMSESMHYEAEVLRKHLKHKGMVDMLAVAEKYPVEHPVVLFSALTGASIAPSERKIAMVSVSDCLNVYHLFVNGRANPRRVVTVCGTNYDLYLGTPVSEVKTLYAVISKENAVAHFGGYVSACRAEENDAIGFETAGIQYLSEYIPATDDCISCGRCNDHCPVGLLPMQLLKLIKKGKKKALMQSMVNACIGCGVCTAVCSVNLDPREKICHYIKNGFSIENENSVSVTQNDTTNITENVEYEAIGSLEEEVSDEKEEN